jgi:CRISPR-associated helicase Cas3
LVAQHWRAATAREGADKKAKEIDPHEIVLAASRAVLLGKGSAPAVDEIATSQPSTWLKRPIACVTGGPVAVPPLTSALIEHWAGTTDPRNDFVPVHPFLYGILPDLEGTPLVSVAFRLEMDVLATDRSAGDEEDDEEGGHACEQITEIFRRFPPQRAEFHFVALTGAREWLASAAAFGVPAAVFDGQDWSVSRDRDDRPALRPGTMLVLPTLARDHVGKLLESANDPKDEKASRDVLEGVSPKRPRYWRRVKRVTTGDHKLVSEDGAARFELTKSADASAAEQTCIAVGGDQPDAPRGCTWAGRLRHTLRIGTAEFRFEYLKPKRVVQQQFLAEHLQAAEEYAGRIAHALSPGSEGLRRLLVEAAKVHDLGKNNPKWQRAMGNSDMSHPVAKPCVEIPLSMKGFRHEWESLVRVLDCAPNVFDSLEEQGWVDLWRHLVVSHHGHLRPWLAERVLEAHALGKQRQSNLRLESAECFARLQGLLGPWRLAYLEGLLKAVDVAASQADEAEENDEQ